MNSKEIENKKLIFRLVSLLVAQAIMLSFSVHFLVKYYNRTLISNLDLFQAFSALGTIGKASFVASLVIIGLILYAVFFKRDKKISVAFLGLLFFQTTLFFILERFYEIYFMYITVLIVATTFVWANFFLVACASSIGLIISFFLLINTFSSE